MSPPAANTRSRSRSPVPRSSRSKSPTPRSGSITPKRGTTSARTATSSSPETAKKASSAQVRSELIGLIDKFPQGHCDPNVKSVFQSKLNEYVESDGADMLDIVIHIGALNFGVNVKKFKLSLIGDAGVGKSSLVRRLLGSAFSSKYEVTFGADVSNVVFQTNKGFCVQLEVWDCSGCERSQGIGDGYFVGSNGCIIMFDLLSNQTYKDLSDWHRSYTRVCADTPIVILGNKTDVKDRKVKPKRVHFPRKKNLPIYEVSVKTGENVHMACLSLVRKLTGDSSIEFANPSARQLGQLKSKDGEECIDAIDVKEAVSASLPKEDAEGL
eukprot:CCRYP_016594-RA/>CCRYP_016594-RA protein AED:0.05 eAED:0.05 QI:1121/1/1/1/0/0/2/155/325